MALIRDSWGSDTVLAVVDRIGEVLFSCVHLFVSCHFKVLDLTICFQANVALYICHSDSLNSAYWNFVFGGFNNHWLQTVSSQCLWETVFVSSYKPVNVSPYRPTCWYAWGAYRVRPCCLQCQAVIKELIVKSEPRASPGLHLARLSALAHSALCSHLYKRSFSCYSSVLLTIILTVHLC